MATLKPFSALRYDEGKVGKTENILCPPYDIIPEEKLKVYMEKSPYNIIHLERPIGEKPYDKAQETLKKFIADGALVHDNKACMYIYEEEFEVNGEIKSFKGLISGVQLEEFSKKIVLPHEETLSKAKEDRLNLMKKTFCNFSLVYSLYFDDEKAVESLLNSCSADKPVVCATDDDGVIHRLWIIDSEDVIKTIADKFSDKKLFIADGHHRYETALNFRNYCRENGLAKEGDGVDNIMMMLVNIKNDGLVVFPTHRIVKNVTDFSIDKIKTTASKYFELSEGENVDNILPELKKAYAEQKKAFALYTGDNKYIIMTFNNKQEADKQLSGKIEAVKDLDVTLLHSLVLDEALGIDTENLANQTNLEYTRDFKEAIDAVDNKTAQCAFILNPTRIEQIANVAQNSGKMPQKSTYFYPKLTTGLVINDLKK